MIRSTFYLAVAITLSTLAALDAQHAPAQPGPGPVSSTLVKTDIHGDPLPHQALLRLGSLRYRTVTDHAYAVAVSPGNRYVAALAAKKVHLFDKASGSLLRLWDIDDDPHQDTLYQGKLAFSPKETHLAVLTGKDRVYLFDIPGGKYVYRKANAGADQPNGPRGFTYPRFLAFSPDGNELVVSNDYLDNTAAAILSPGRSVVVPPYARTEPTQHVYVLDAGTGTFVRSLFRGDNNFPLMTVALSGDGTRLALTQIQANAASGITRVINVATGKNLSEWSENLSLQQAAQWSNQSLALSPDGTRVVLALPVRVVVFSETGLRIAEFKWNQPAFPPAAAFAPDGSSLLLNGVRTPLEIWNTRTWQHQATVPVPELFPAAVAKLAPDGKTLAFTHGSKIRFWDLRTKTEIGIGPAESLHPHYQIRFAPDGRALAASGHQTEVWDLKTARLKFMTPGVDRNLVFTPDSRQLTFFASAEANAYALAFRGLPSGAANQDWVESRDAARGELKSHWSLPRDRTFRLLVTRATADNRFVSAAFSTVSEGDTDRSVTLARFDFATGKVLHQVRVAGKEPGQVHFSPDGKWAFGASSNYRSLSGADDIREPFFALFDTRTGKHHPSYPTLPPPDFILDDLAFAPSSHWFLLRTGRHLTLRETATGRPVWQLALPGAQPGSFAVSPDGRFVALAEIPDTTAFLGDHLFHDTRVLPGVFGSHPIRILDILTAEQVASFRGDRSAVTTLAFSADGKRLASGHEDGTLLVWDTGSLRPAAQVNLTPQQLDRAWRDLADEHSEHAFGAMARLAASPQQAVDLLRQRTGDLAPVIAVRQWIDDLGSKKFAVRQIATKELELRRDFVEPMLLQAQAEKKSLELVQRLELILNKPPGPPPAEFLRIQRALQVLEWVGGKEAEALLGELVQRGQGTVVVELAGDALQRLRQVAAKHP